MFVCLYVCGHAHTKNESLLLAFEELIKNDSRQQSSPSLKKREGGN